MRARLWWLSFHARINNHQHELGISHKSLLCSGVLPGEFQLLSTALDVFTIISKAMVFSIQLSTASLEHSRAAG
jgi:hypothetical protein